MQEPDDRIAVALTVPLPCALGVRLADRADPSAGVLFPVRGLAATPFGTLHAGALSTVLELAAYLAVLPGLDRMQHAVTHAIAVQFVAPALEGEDVVVVGGLTRRGRKVAFLAATATVQQRVIAEAQITKSIIELA